MIIQKLRLQQGWSQQQLAEMSGLSTRTIQRIENGQKPSMESVKSLAAVFEVNFNHLQEALTMNTDIKHSSNLANSASSTNLGNSGEPRNENQYYDLRITESEKRAFKRVRKLKKFYLDLSVYIVVVAALAVINFLTSPDYLWVGWVILGWGVSFVIRGIKLFLPFPWLGAEWEKQQVEKQINRKL